MKKGIALCLVMLMVLATVTGCTQNNGPNSNESPVSNNTDPNGAVTSTAGQPTGGTNATPKEIIIGVDYDATTFDTHNMDDDGSYIPMRLIGEGLVRNNNGVISPGVAERWDVSADNLTYTFHLRTNALWSDGTQLSAYDFEYAFKRMLDPALGLTNASAGIILFKNAEEYYNGAVTIDKVGFKALNDSTLEITTNDVNIETLFSLADYSFFPVKESKVNAEGEAYGSEADTILTNGAFTMSEWRHEDRQILVKNEYYWNKEAIKLDKITRLVNISQDTAYDMLLVGELNAATFSDITKVEKLESEGYNSITYVSTYHFAHMNSTGSSDATRPFMENINFRRALNYAVNRLGLTQSVYKGGEPATRITAPIVMGVSLLFNEEYPYQAWPQEGDPVKAKECLNLALQELGVTLDQVPELSLLCYESQSSTLILQAVQDMILSTLGIKSKVDPQPVQQMLEKADNGDWDLWWGGKDVGDLDWLSTFAIDFDYTNISDVSNYHNDRYLDLLVRARYATTMKERKDLLFEMEKELCENPPSILVGWRQAWDVITSTVTGARINRAVVDYTYADISQ